MKSATNMLLKLTDREVWIRGEAYARSPQVEINAFDDREIHATVRGSELYRVSLRFASNGISRDCECAFYRKAGSICKHIVAVAICWDLRRGLAAPDCDEVERTALQRSTVSRRDIDNIFRKPNKADLALVRILPEVTALGGRGRLHSNLPEAPKALSDITDTLTTSQIKKCFSEIRSWSRRRAYDPYFCAGEMIAAFCQVMRTVTQHLEVTPVEVSAKVLVDAQSFHQVLVTELIDDSMGLRIVSEAQLDEVFAQIRQRCSDDGGTARVEVLLQEYERRRGEY